MKNHIYRPELDKAAAARIPATRQSDPHEFRKRFSVRVGEMSVGEIRRQVIHDLRGTQ